MITDYSTHINQAINYIYDNLDRELTVEEIAEKCCFSKFHFNRIFKSFVGENIYSFIRRMKLERAAFRLKTTRRSVTDLAIEAGYSSSNFASAFKQYFGVSASEFRRTHRVPSRDYYADVVAHIQSLKKDEEVFQRIDQQVEIRPMDSMNLLYRRVICNYARELKTAWEEFCRELETKDLLHPQSRFIGISYDDPLLVDEDRCVYDMCVDTTESAGFQVHRIPAGRYACYRFHDKLDQLIFTIHEICSLWLPFCDYELDDRPLLELYHSGLDGEGRICLDICIPVKHG